MQIVTVLSLRGKRFLFTFAGMPALKDYYRILDLPAGAGLQEIRQAYRRLAKKFHPDKTGNDPEAAIRFTEIREAYDILSDPARKEAYLQQRWYARSTGVTVMDGPVTPETLLKKWIDLEKYIATLDHFRVNRQQVFQQLEELLNEDQVNMLNHAGREDIRENILHTASRCLHVLTPEQAKTIARRLGKLNNTRKGEAALENILLKIRKEAHREKTGIWLALVMALLICLLIFFAGR